MFVGCAPTPTLAPLPASTQPTVIGELTDCLDIAVVTNPEAHGLVAEGTVKTTVYGERVGAHDMRRMCHVVRGPNASVSYRIGVTPNQPTTLEIEELDDRNHDVRAYYIFVDGVKTYFRTFRGCGAGPVHYFVQIPPVSLDHVTVKFVNQAPSQFAISRIWAFSNFDAYFAANDMAVPYRIAPTVRLKWGDPDADVEQIKQIKRSLGNHPNVKPAWTAMIGYADLDSAEIPARIDYLLKLADASGLPVQIGLNSWWGNTPTGSDGSGGTWRDVKYHQVTFNETTKRFGLSIPNRWGSMPWLTVNNAELNEFKTSRLTLAAQMLAAKCHELRAAGKGDLLLAINLDNEPVYWASGNAGLGEGLLLADFNPAAFEAAKRDGVTLDPTDGLGPAERMWLSQNLLNYNQSIANAVIQGLGVDPLVANSSGVQTPGDPLRCNVYTQAMVAKLFDQYPMLDRAYPLWETAAPNSVRVGGEWDEGTMAEREAVLHQLPLGRSAVTNAECEGRAENSGGVAPGYALGQRYFTLYNYPLDKMDVAASGLKDLRAPFAPDVYRIGLLETEFGDASWKEKIIDSQGVETIKAGNAPNIALAPADPAVPGFVTFRIESQQGDFDGLALELFGRAIRFEESDPDVNIRVLVGEVVKPEGMTEVARLFDRARIDARDAIDLSAYARGRKAIYVRIELNASRVQRANLSWCSIFRVRFSVPWAKSMTADLPPQDQSLATARKQNLLVSWRRDAELAIAEMALKPPSPQTKAADEMFKRGEYAHAYAAANRAMVDEFPATYVVSEKAELKPFPIRVQSPLPLTVVVKQCDVQTIRLALACQRTTEAKLTISNLPPDQSYQLRHDGDEWVLSRSNVPMKLRADKRGEVQWSAHVTPVAKFLSPPVVVGAFSMIYKTRDDAFVMALLSEPGNRLIKMDARTVIRRSSATTMPATATLQDLRRGDRVKVTIEDGVAREVDARSQIVRGKIAEFQQFSPIAMAMISLENDKARRVIDLSARVHDEKRFEIVRQIPMGQIKLAKGESVAIRVNPDTGRVYEIWKGEQIGRETDVAKD